MSKFLIVLTVFLLSVYYCNAGQLLAGVSKIDGTLPYGENGAPIAGFNHGDRRVPTWPLPHETKYTTFMTPSQGVMNPTWIKALVIDSGDERVCFVTMDTMCADSSLEYLAWLEASVQGFTIPLDKITFSGSHTHSGPGGWVPQFGIQVTPTFDLFVPNLQKMLANSIAKAMVEAERNLQPALIGTGVGQITNVTHNRRSKISPYVNDTTIDPNCAIIRVDDTNGNPIATLWNFAVHGVCFGSDNMLFSSDIMGGASDNIEEIVGGVALFVNGDAGDISPTGAACNNKPNYDGAVTIANVVKETREKIDVVSEGDIFVYSYEYDFGQMLTNWTLAREKNCTHGGPLDICTICEIRDCTLDIRGGEAWVEETPRFSAFRLALGNNNTAIVTIPGEALLELGWQIRNDTLDLGFKDTTFLFGYTNNYLMYFATPNEYVLGGYEANLTLWGIDTAEKIRVSVRKAAENVKP
eukprot:TRINITY_DN3864_c0_g1_i1.p1 TRINITY_DN3864_c0_g1~~TRINITY_DN3864_c0_g1_i1.p1  ORF type:complete len:468 (+),score=190.18 TRINITY_DN3864_c0_g1_i1:25-1428(+)